MNLFLLVLLLVLVIENKILGRNEERGRGRLNHE
jgi:hypothetical protein